MDFGMLGSHRRSIVRRVSLTLLLFFTAAGAMAQQPPAEQKHVLPTRLADQAIKDDLDGLIEKRVIRVAVPYSRTLYYNDKGRERGLTADFVRDFERYINTKYQAQLGKRPITVVMRPTTRDVLLKDVAEARADIGAGNLTVTDERKKLVDFVAAADQKPISEVVLTGPKSPAVAWVEDIAGKTVHVRKTSSYHDSLVALNERLQKDGKPAVRLVFVPDALEDGDMMEMVNAGLLETIVVDDWLARIWSPVLPAMKINDGAAVHTGGVTGWAIRKNSPKMTAELNDFYGKFMKSQKLIEARIAQYHKNIKQIKDSGTNEDRKRFQATLELFRTYGQKDGFDPLMLAAQGYQESQLNQSAKSQVGAIGVMQVMPATGADLKVGDIHQIEPNIHAGTKYMDQLMTKYMGDAQFDEANRSLFAFASCNAGPGNISRMRKEANSRGLDPDKWFNNVELVTAEKIGIETTTYVRNIYKYYVAYKLIVDAEQVKGQAREAVAPKGKS